MGSKIWAKRIAAFQLAIDLREDLELDAHLKPVYEPNKKHAMANAHLAMSSKRGKGYKYKKKAVFWTPEPEPPKELWVTIITIENTEVMGFGYQPYMLFTRRKMPWIPKFDLYFDKGPSPIKVIRLSKPIIMSEYHESFMEELNQFTVRVFHHIFNKRFAFTTEVTPYWIGPALVTDTEITEDTEFGDAMDWEQFLYAARNEYSDFSFLTSDDESAKNKVMLEVRNHSRRFLSLGIARDLKPSDPCPEDAPGYKKFTIFEYTHYMVQTGDWRKKETAYIANLKTKEDVVVKVERITQWFPQTFNSPRDAKNLKKTAYICSLAYHCSSVRITLPQRSIQSSNAD